MKKFINNYWKPTPLKWRKIGDSILVIGTLISTSVLADYEKSKELLGVADLKYFVITSLICTTLGKIITNFATEEQVNEQ